MTVTSRRALLGATAALAALPTTGLAAATHAAPRTTLAATPYVPGQIRQLWDEVIDLSIRLNGHAHTVSKIDRGNDLPGWMYVEGEANELGNRRYDALMAILHAKPETPEDIAIIARAATHGDVQSGPRTYAAARLAHSAMTLAA